MEDRKITELNNIINELKTNIDYSRKQKLLINNKHLLFNFKKQDCECFFEHLNHFENEEFFIINLKNILIISK